MSPLVLALTTPIFGFSLTPPTYAIPSFADDVAREVAAAEPAPAEWEEEEALVQRQLATRRTMSDWMTAIGIATWAGMATTVTLGAFHFHDRYGFAGSYQETPCARGAAVMQEYCEGTVWPHAIAAGTTTSLYVTNAMLGMFMPDPLGASEQPGERGDRIRAHRTLRWVTSGLLIAQALLGLLISHPDWIGLHDERDFDAIQGMAIAHLGLGWAAFASYSAQGAVMIF